MQLKRLALASVMLPFAVSAATADDDAQALSTRIRDEVRTARALPDLYRVYELRDELSDLGPFARLLDQVAADESARADVRAAALELRAQVAIAQGQLPQARTTSAALNETRLQVDSRLREVIRTSRNVNG